MKSMKSTVKLMNGEDVLKILSEQAPAGACIMQDGKFCYINSFFSIATGYTMDELVGKDSLKIVISEDREMVTENTLRMLNGELLAPYQFRVICKDGRVIWVMATVKSVQYRGRRAVLGNYMEITQRKQVEDAVRQSEENYRLLSEQAPVGVCIMQDGKFCYVNSYFPIAVGYTVDELVGRDSLEIVVPEDREMVMENTIKMLKGELLAPYQFRVTCKDGNTIWVIATVKSIQYHGRRATLGNYMEITGRKQIEESLKESEEKYKELADSVTDIFFAMDEHLRYTYWNKASEILTGIRAEDALGKSLLEIFPDTPGLRNAEKIYSKVLWTQEPQTFVNDYDIGDRHYVFEISAYPSRGGISVFAKDITERKQAEQRLREAEEEKSAFLEEAPVAIIHADLEGKITYVNRRFELESGYSREEIIGKVGLQLGWFSADITKYLAERMAARLTGSPAKHWEAQFKCKDGRLIWIELEGKVISKLGVPVGFQIISNNITERKGVEEALRRSEERYRTMLEEMEEGYYEVDIAGNFTFVNDAMSRILGYSRDELIGLNYKIYTPKEDIKPIFQAFNRVYRTGEPLKWFPMPEIRKDGTGILAEDSVFPLRNEKGEVIGFRGISRDITERKRTEEALRHSEDRYRTILEETGDGYFETDLRGNFTFVNDAQARLLGCSREDIIGVSYRAFTPEDKAKSVFQAYNHIYKTGKPLMDFPDEVIRKDGSRGLAQTSAFPIRDYKGDIIGFRGVRRDMTEHKKAEDALRQSEERYRTILEEMEDSYFEVDLGGHFTFVNSSTCRNLGYSREEVSGLSYKSFTAQEHIESVFRVFNEVYRTGVPNKGFPWRIIRKDGGHGFAEASVSLLRNDNGEITGFRGVGRDITERKQAEEKLRQSEENYRALFDSGVIGTVLLDAETMKIAMANKVAVKMFGFGSEEEVLGLDPFAFVLPQDRERYIEIATKALFEQNSPEPVEIRAVGKDGRERWIKTTATTITHKGKFTALISFVDITEEKQQRDRLMMTDRLASLGEMASGAAHELNNPLTSILGFSQLLMDRKVPEDIREDLKLINSEAQRAASVTQNLLTFARKQAPMKQRNHINNIIDDVLRLRTYEHKANGIEVERHLDPNLPKIMADYFQMQQVFMNIIINAEYFMVKAHNRGTLTVTTKKKNGTVLISIADDGPGIPAENLKRIFDPFFTTKEPGKGTGLGLSICHGIVTEHGGQIYAKSELGKGATIFVQLPISDRDHTGGIP